MSTLKNSGLKAYQKGYREANKVRMDTVKKNWKINNKEKIKAYHRKHQQENKPMYSEKARKYR